MHARVHTRLLHGLDGYPAHIIVEVASDPASFSIAGFPEDMTAESQSRIRKAIRNSGFYFPHDKAIICYLRIGGRGGTPDLDYAAPLVDTSSTTWTSTEPETVTRITVNLAPADVRKAGPSFDLPIAVGLLVATGQLSGENLEEALLVGELSLDGGVRPVTGALPIAIGARQRRQTRLYLPAANAREAAIVEGVDVFPITTLSEIARALALPETLDPLPRDPSVLDPSAPHFPYDFADVKGHAHVKRALEVAAAGGHNLLLIGPPGSGKTMMARRLPSILPPMSVEEALEATKIASFLFLF